MPRASFGTKEYLIFTSQPEITIIWGEQWAALYSEVQIADQNNSRRSLIFIIILNLWVETTGTAIR